MCNMDKMQQPIQLKKVPIRKVPNIIRARSRFQINKQVPLTKKSPPLEEPPVIDLCGEDDDNIFLQGNFKLAQNETVKPNTKLIYLSQVASVNNSPADLMRKKRNAAMKNLKPAMPKTSTKPNAIESGIEKPVINYDRYDETSLEIIRIPDNNTNSNAEKSAEVISKPDVNNYRNSIIYNESSRAINNKRKLENGNGIIYNETSTAISNKRKPENGNIIIFNETSTAINNKRKPDNGNSIIFNETSTAINNKRNPENGNSIIFNETSTAINNKRNPENGNSIIYNETLRNNKRKPEKRKGENSDPPVPHLIREPFISNESNTLFDRKAPPGNRVVDLGYVLTWFQSMIFRHNIDCNGHLKLKREQVLGLVSSLIFKCDKCLKMYVNDTHKSTDVNRKMVWETLEANISFENSNAIFTSVNVPPVSRYLFNVLEKQGRESDTIYRDAMMNLELICDAE